LLRSCRRMPRCCCGYGRRPCWVAQGGWRSPSAHARWPDADFAVGIAIGDVEVRSHVCIK
jgi:hypothetical protein